LRHNKPSDELLRRNEIPSLEGIRVKYKEVEKMKKIQLTIKDRNKIIEALKIKIEMANRMTNDTHKKTAIYYEEEVKYLKKLINKIS
jgi:hypothetical protein